ncbi:hypothetical protein FisN_33Hu022 [Fistulifera solaris]|uniref:Uncharacterized protein n=1 Tax=Fistulifera solaris TaxID=1519565 RepID=A0A1Z5KRT1_FISSO|nr:hypothetical protein FisN_33Hu022 [Fistulifera solaris]|eukprot:GAX28701.1 hypothetical protein FisN_33Hu022 [Fistulifera solaris]
MIHEKQDTEGPVRTNAHQLVARLSPNPNVNTPTRTPTSSQQQRERLIQILTEALELLNEDSWNFEDEDRSSDDNKASSHQRR